jgi:hypothetical protein
MLYDIHPHNDEPMVMTCLRVAVEGIVLIGFLFSIVIAVVVFAVWAGVI